LYEVGGHPVIVVENDRSRANEPGGLYVSAGIHGDECAPVWGLLEWVAGNPPALRDRPVMIFPCLNPVGLIDNTRRDGFGVDLNRSFSDTANPLIDAWQKRLEGRCFDISVNLHEDYDCTGIYLYELSRDEARGDSLLAACEGIIPRESASEIDGSDFQNGVLVRTSEIEQIVEEQLGGSYPEAILLFLKYARYSYTFETPSEFDLPRRIAAQRAFLEAVTEG